MNVMTTARLIVLSEIARGERQFPETPEAMSQVVESVARWLMIGKVSE